MNAITHIDQHDDCRVPDITFEALMTGEDITDFLQNCLDDRILALKQSLMLAALGRSEMVSFLRGLDDDAKMNLVETATDFSKWAKEIAEIAEATAVRSLVAIAEVADMLRPATSAELGEAVA